MKLPTLLFLISVALIVLSEAGFNPVNIPRPSIQLCRGQCPPGHWNKPCAVGCTCRRRLDNAHQTLICVRNNSPLPGFIQ
uniref:Putative secreted protein n=1 Tax=Amblyomma triste TaxID=251400 RepID=A0A023G122_AMBTT